MNEERRLAAIMFSDICGFSKIMEKNEKQALEIVELAFSCISQAVEQYGGRIIKKIGDGILCEFSSAVNAVRAAIDVQKAISDYNRNVSKDEQFLLRIGIHVGDIIVADGGDIFGDGVNIASRIEPMAEPGGICISQDVFDLVKNKVSIETVSLGPKELKNISRQIEIYKILLDAVEYKFAVPCSKRKILTRKKVVVTVIILFSCFLLLFLCTVISRKNKDKKDEQAFKLLVNEVKIYEEEGSTDKAFERVKRFSKEHPNFQKRQKLLEIENRLQKRIAHQELIQKQYQFIKAVMRNDREEVLKLINPETLRRADSGAIWFRTRIGSMFLNLVGIAPEDFKIVDIDFDDSKENAKVKMVVIIKKPQGIIEQRPVPPFCWKKIGNEWFLDLTTKPPL